MNKRLLSRKYHVVILAILAVEILALTGKGDAGSYGALGGMVMAYLGIQGWADAKGVDSRGGEI